MSLLNFEVFKKVKPTLTSLLDIFFGGSKSKHQQEDIDVFGDKFVRTGTDNLNSTPITRKVWVNGQSFTIMGFSEQELTKKLEKIQHSQVNTKQAVDVSPLLFNNRYTEEQKLEENEWILKKDVWVDEYYPA